MARYDENGNEMPCSFCGSYECDGSGYNCDDGHFPDDYNLRGWPEDEDDDSWQAFKDGVAMGYHDRDGKQLDPPEPDGSEYAEENS